MLIRRLAVALLAFTLIPPSLAQVPPAPAPATKPTAAAKKPAGKTATPKPPAAAVDSGPCDTGVIAALGDSFTVQKNGLTRMTNDYAEVPAAWGFDDLVFARVRAVAGDAGVRRLVVPKGTFDTYYQSPPIKAENGTLAPLVRKLAESARCTRYLVVTRRTDSEPSTNDEVTGIGVINRGEGFGRYTHVFVMMDIQLYDGTTFEAREPATSSKSFLSRLTSGVGPPSHAGDVDNANFPAAPPDAATNTVLRDMARSMLKFRLDQRLPAYFGRE